MVHGPIWRGSAWPALESPFYCLLPYDPTFVYQQCFPPSMTTSLILPSHQPPPPSSKHSILSPSTSQNTWAQQPFWPHCLCLNCLTEILSKYLDCILSSSIAALPSHMYNSNHTLHHFNSFSFPWTSNPCTWSFPTMAVS